MKKLVIGIIIIALCSVVAWADYAWSYNHLKRYNHEVICTIEDVSLIKPWTWFKSETIGITWLIEYHQVSEKYFLVHAITDMQDYEEPHEYFQIIDMNNKKTAQISENLLKQLTPDEYEYNRDLLWIKSDCSNRLFMRLEKEWDKDQ